MFKQKVGHHASVVVDNEIVNNLGAERIGELTAAGCGEAFAGCMARRRDKQCTIQAQVARVLGETRASYACGDDVCSGPEAAALKLHRTIAMEEPTPAFDFDDLAIADL